MEIERIGLIGVGQLVQVVDSGLDFNSPFFFDPAVAVTPRRNAWKGFAEAASPHRKVEDYWAVADGFDSPSDRATLGSNGHGTHCAGSIGGAAVITAATPPEDALLGVLSGTAAGARLAVVDVGCDTPTGCTTAPATTAAPCGLGSLCAPPFDLLFGAGYAQEARISSNSYGGLNTGAYTLASASIDAYAHAHPEFLPVFAAANDGFSTGSISLSTQAVSKNVLTVGATNDGLPAHLAKIKPFTVEGVTYPAMYQDASPKSCVSVLSFAASAGLTCPSDPATNAQQCYASYAAWQGQQVPGFSSDPGANAPYGRSGNMEFPLCCGCSPILVLQGALESSAAEAQQFISSFAGRLNFSPPFGVTPGIYYSRFPSGFSSLGPAADGRIKPDVTAPGVEIISARSAGAAGRPYGTFTCSAGQLSTTILPGTSFSPLTVPAGLFATSSIVVTREPVFVTTVVVPYAVSSPPSPGAVITLEVQNLDRNQPVPSPIGPVFVFPQRFSVTALSGLATFTLDFELHAGATVSFIVRFQGLPSGLELQRNSDPDSVPAAQCFGTMSEFTTSRGKLLHLVNLSHFSHFFNLFYFPPPSRPTVQHDHQF